MRPVWFPFCPWCLVRNCGKKAFGRSWTRENQVPGRGSGRKTHGWFGSSILPAGKYSFSPWNRNWVKWGRGPRGAMWRLKECCKGQNWTISPSKTEGFRKPSGWTPHIIPTQPTILTRKRPSWN